MWHKFPSPTGLFSVTIMKVACKPESTEILKCSRFNPENMHYEKSAGCISKCKCVYMQIYTFKNNLKMRPRFGKEVREISGRVGREEKEGQNDVIILIIKLKDVIFQNFSIHHNRYSLLLFKT